MNVQHSVWYIGVVDAHDDCISLDGKFVMHFPSRLHVLLKLYFSQECTNNSRLKSMQ